MPLINAAVAQYWKTKLHNKTYKRHNQTAGSLPNLGPFLSNRTSSAETSLPHNFQIIFPCPSSPTFQPLYFKYQMRNLRFRYARRTFSSTSLVQRRIVVFLK